MPSCSTSMIATGSVRGKCWAPQAGQSRRQPPWVGVGRRAAARAEAMGRMIMQDRLGLGEHRELAAGKRLFVGQSAQVADLQVRPCRQDQPALVDEGGIVARRLGAARPRRAAARRKPARWRRAPAEPPRAPVRKTRAVSRRCRADRVAPSRRRTGMSCTKTTARAPGAPASSARAPGVGAPLRQPVERVAGEADRDVVGIHAAFQHRARARTAARRAAASSAHRARPCRRPRPGRARRRRPRNARRHGHAIAPPYCRARRY